MDIYEVKQISQNVVRVVHQNSGVVIRMLTIKVDDELIVDSDDPTKEENRGRTCIIKSFLYDENYPLRANVYFVDTGESEYIDVRDLKVNGRVKIDE